jgi:predicted alpha/beta superfamily hydrolase
MKCSLKTTLFLLITTLVTNTLYCQFKVKFKVIQSPASHSSDTLFVAGNFNNWDPALKENSFTTDKNGIGNFEMQLPAGNYEYKFARGTWDKVECLSDGSEGANRVFTLKKDTTIYVSIMGWKDDFAHEPVVRKHTASVNVKIIDAAFLIPQLNRPRRLWIYLPKDYEKNKKRYPVIYMHDGQNLFDEATSGFGEWGVDEYLDSLPATKKQSIIVGIDHGNNKRMNEYNPYYFEQFGNGEGKKYVDFLVQTLKPYIDKHYRTLKNKENTFIAGSSMGGLISLYAVLKYPSVFGGAGIFSPAFWTAGEIDKDVALISSKINSKLFFYAGGKESDKMVPDMKRVEEKIKRLSKSAITTIIDADAKHNEAAWRKYFPRFYEWMIRN